MQADMHGFVYIHVSRQVPNCSVLEILMYQEFWHIEIPNGISLLEI